MSIAILSTLEQADFTIEQAKAITKVFEEDHHNLATKDDIKSLEFRMASKEETRAIRGDIKAIRENIKSMEAKMATKEDIRVLEARMATKEETQFIREDIKDIRGDIKSMEAKMVTKVESNKINNNMIKWIVTGIFLNVGVLYMLLKYLGV